MLLWLHIRDLALIAEADLNFAPGFTVITGETGAGKSVLVGAVSLLLGERADTTLVRSGAEKAEISAGFMVSAKLRQEIDELLQPLDLAVAEDGNLLVRRVITAAGSRNFLNDVPVTVATLAALGDILIDMHGPHEHQSLLRPAIQLDILDRFSGAMDMRRKLSASWQKLQQKRAELDELRAQVPSALEAEHLHAVVAEIEKAAPVPGEQQELQQRHKLAANARDIIEVAEQGRQVLCESDDSLLDRIGILRRELESLVSLGIEEVENWMKTCDNMAGQADEIARELEGIAAGIELDEREFAALEERLQVLRTIERKYGPGVEKVLAAAEEAKQRLMAREDFEYMMEQAQNAITEAENAHLKNCQQLSKKRTAAARRFSPELCRELVKLGFPDAVFSINLTESDPGPKGADRCEYMFTANRGESEKPLRQVASSGEISRVMLALKTVLSSADEVPVLIFDEIDVNIGGETAGVVACELRKLGQSHQVLCISHLPQVAALAEQHFHVDKVVEENRSKTSIRILAAPEREDEIARMLGGGKAAREHAVELLSSPTLTQKRI